MENRNLAIIGASYLQLPLIEKAQDMGYVTHVFAWEANDIGEKKADYFYPISIIEKDKILEKCKEINICGICSIASDLAIITVNYVANKLNLPGNSISCTQKSTNKHLMRQCFEKNHNPSPKSYLIDNEQELNKIDINFPVILKPTDRSGSRGIYKINGKQELLNAYLKSKKESFEGKVLIEEFVQGQEYSVEYITYKGKHTFLAMTLKYTTGSPHFIETGHLEPAPVSKNLLLKVKEIVESALDSLEITNGASHSEVKIDEFENIKIIEIGGRMGGDCIGSDLVKYSTGYDFVKMVIQIACGQEPDLTKYSHIGPVVVKFILTEQDIADFYEMKKSTPDRILKITDFDPNKINHTTDSSNRAGCYIYKV